MFRKQVVAFVLAAAILTVPAFAHGCKGRRVQTVDASCGLCTVEDCAITGRHTHRGVTYCGYDHAGGVCDGTCYALCGVEGCDLTGRHTHDGVTYCGYAHAHGFCDGTCYALCSVEGCDSTGRHTHDGVTYCGYAHAHGFCDGVCLNAAPAQTGEPASYGYGHHGGHHGGRHH